MLHQMVGRKLLLCLGPCQVVPILVNHIQSTPRSHPANDSIRKGPSPPRSRRQLAIASHRQSRISFEGSQLTTDSLSELENDTGLKTEQKLNEFLTDRTHTDELYSTPLEAAADILSSSWQRRISKVKIPEFGTAISMPIKRRQTLIQDQKLTDYHWWLTT